jgi:hypothetical protein
MAPGSVCRAIASSASCFARSWTDVVVGAAAGFGAGGGMLALRGAPPSFAWRLTSLAVPVSVPALACLLIAFAAPVSVGLLTGFGSGTDTVRLSAAGFGSAGADVALPSSSTQWPVVGSPTQRVAMGYRPRMRFCAWRKPPTSGPELSCRVGAGAGTVSIANGSW